MVYQKSKLLNYSSLLKYLQAAKEHLLISSFIIFQIITYAFCVLVENEYYIILHRVHAFLIDANGLASAMAPEILAQ